MTNYACPLHGIEFTDEDLPLTVRATFCPECLEQQGIAAAKAQREFDEAYRAWHGWLRDSGVPPLGRNRTLDNWTPQGRTQETAAKFLRRYASTIGGQVSAGKGVTLLGPPGVGKTHLGYGLLAAAYAAGLSGRYIVWGDVVERTKAAFGAREAQDRKLLDILKRVPLLVLDEIGVRTGSEFDQGLLFDLVDTRYRFQRSTVAIGNLTEGTLDDIGERTADRLREVNLTVSLSGDSQRARAGNNHMFQEAPPALLEPVPPVLPFSLCINGQMVERPLPIRKPEVW